MIVIGNVEQRSPEWYKIKAGIPSASNFSLICTMKGEKSKSARKYMMRLAAQAITGKIEETYISKKMQKGIDTEDEAIKFYEVINGVTAERPAFIFHDENRSYGCSPDAIFEKSGERWGLELKVPDSETHVEYLYDKKLPSIYYHQVQGSLLVTGFSRWDFLSYSPDGLTPLIVQVTRNEAFIQKLKERLEEFCFDLAQMIKEIKEMGQ